MISKINYLDLFSGIGGFRLGLERAGISFGYEGHSEIDKYANRVYAKHFPESEDLGDVRNLVPGILPRIDLLSFGFPCQDLSVAGRRQGLDGERSGLFFEAVRLIKALKPRVFVFENVKGLLSSNKGRDFETALRTIADIGIYDCEWQLVNTRWFLPQNRERVYFVGHTGGESGFKVFPLGLDDGVSHAKTEAKWVTEGEGIAYTLDANYYKGPGNQARSLIKVNQEKKQGYRIYSPEGIASNLNSSGGGTGAKTGLYLVKDKSRDKSLAYSTYTPCIRARANGNGPCIAVLRADKKERYQNGRDFKENEEAMFSLTASDKHGVYQHDRVRKLTPKECERLQGFPDDWTIGLSDTQRYKCLGNAVSVPVVRAVGERINMIFQAQGQANE